jgi:uncharacterized protein YjgD (DUF1641 family)
MGAGGLRLSCREGWPLMAKPIAFTPRTQEPEPAPADAAHAELDTLLTALHERGILRLLNGLLAAGPEVSAKALDGLNTPAGERAIRNTVALGTAATRIDPNRMQQLLDGVARGVDAAGARLVEEPPGSVSLLKELRDPDVRRGMHAVIGFLKAFGAPEPTGDDAERNPRPKRQRDAKA